MTPDACLGRASGLPAAFAVDSRWLAERLEAAGLVLPAPADQRHRPRRVDVLLAGRPAALLERPTTPLWATK